MNNDQTRSLIRKNIWEVDCLSLSTILASAFDSGELANLISGEGDLHQIHADVHQLCHSENDFSVKLENVLNHRYRHCIEKVNGLEATQLCRIAQVKCFDRIPHLAGWLWALATDTRQGMEKIRSYFLERFLNHAVHAYMFGSF